MASQPQEIIQGYSQNPTRTKDGSLRNFRRIMLAGVLLILLLVVLWIRDSREAGRVMREASLQSTSLIREAKLEDLSLRIRPGASRLGGRLTNLSQDATLTAAELAISVQDCVQSACETVGETSVYLDGYSIPPGQSRAIDRLVRFAALPQPKGEYRWHYDVLRVWGY